MLHHFEKPVGAIEQNQSPLAEAVFKLHGVLGCQACKISYKLRKVLEGAPPIALKIRLERKFLQQSVSKNKVRSKKGDCAKNFV